MVSGRRRYSSVSSEQNWSPTMPRCLFSDRHTQIVVEFSTTMPRHAFSRASAVCKKYYGRKDGGGNALRSCTPECFLRLCISKARTFLNDCRTLLGYTFCARCHCVDTACECSAIVAKVYILLTPGAAGTVIQPTTYRFWNAVGTYALNR